MPAATSSRRRCRLRCVERDGEVPALDEVCVDAVALDDARDLVDGREHRALQRLQAPSAGALLVDASGPGEEAGHPAAVAPRGSEAGDLALEHDDPQRRLARA